ncbi:MAG TPA: hypothetical protein VFE46_01695 [Pirellulales bacterium]|jgi:hypothetical protein|nr:hypothetical protein [Pirellulales bacterium]
MNDWIAKRSVRSIQPDEHGSWWQRYQENLFFILAFLGILLTGIVLLAGECCWLLWLN